MKAFGIFLMGFATAFLWIVIGTVFIEPVFMGTSDGLSLGALAVQGVILMIYAGVLFAAHGLI